MYNEQIEALISAALADGVLTEKEKQVLFKKAQSMGIDLDEFEMVLDARLVELKKAEKEKAEKSAPKSDKYGSVRKCPACGAIVPAFQGVCPECGFEFTDVDANASSKKLADALLKETSESKQKRIIETFPLPNTKADLLEFLTALKPRISDFDDPLATSYFKKYQECIEKAKVTFPEDKLIAPFIAEHDVVLKKYQKAQSAAIRKQKRASIKKWWDQYDIVVIVVGIPLLLLIALFSWIGTCSVKSAVRKSKAKAYTEKVEQMAATTSVTDDEIIESFKQNANFPGSLEVLTTLLNNKKLDAAIYYFDNVLPPKEKDGTIKKKKWYNNSDVYIQARKMMYDAMLSNERMEDVKQYGDYDWCEQRAHQTYTLEVINWYCEHGKIQEAKNFANQQVGWFKRNVDAKYKPSNWEFEEYNSKEMQELFNKTIKSYE